MDDCFFHSVGTVDARILRIRIPDLTPSHMLLITNPKRSIIYITSTSYVRSS